MTQDIHILVVEDESINRTVIKLFLHQLGYKQITFMMDAKQTLDFLKDENNPPKLDVILMDIGLGPGMDGIALTEKIRQGTSSAKNVPIIALTGNDEDETKKRCFAVGMNDFLTKPTELTLLSDALKKVLAA